MSAEPKDQKKEAEDSIR